MNQQDKIGREAADQILGSFGTDVQEESVPTAIKRYRDEVDPKLVNAGWGFELAKSVDHDKIDQSLVNHVRCGVFALARMNEIVETAGGYTLSDDRLRDVIALFVLHDIHKLDAERDDNPETRFDIPKSEAEAYAERFRLYEFAGTDDEGLLRKMFHDCAIDHHDDWTAYTDQTSVEFDERRPFVRLADAFASSETPEQATDERTQSALDAAYPGENFTLRNHVLGDVKGVLTNLVNSAVADTLAQQGYEKLLLYQDGCVYFLPGDGPELTVDDRFVTAVFDELKESVRGAHEAYRDATKLRNNLTTRSQGFYGINDQDFFYAGTETVLEAVALNSVTDADPEDEPTDSMAETMAGLETHLPFEIDRTREPVGFARLVYTVKRSFVDPVLDATDDDRDGVTATCEVFGVADAVRDGLGEAAGDDDLGLTAGGKWDYAYGIGQALIESNETDPDVLAVRVAEGLAAMSEDWREIIEAEHAGNIRTELDAYLRDIVSVSGRGAATDEDMFADPFEEYGGSHRGKTCNLCNRGTAGGTKGDMKAPKSLTTLQAGYANHIAVDSGKPDELLACVPCQIELSLRETGSARREAGRLFIHLVPDYFYTPLSWRSYTRLTSEFSGNSKTELGGLAKSILALGEDDEALGDFVESMFDEEHGRSMIETLDQGFNPDAQFGARTLGYFKPNDHDTEFQFFGVFAALAIAAYSGLRVAVSESPIPDVRGRDFRTFAHVGSGFTQVHDFYGTDVPLSDLQGRLHAAAALIRLGYEHSPLVGKNDNPKDTMFAKYLRLTRNQLLPGSHLLKRVAQADDSGNAQYLLEEARVLDETTGLKTDS
jgi:CRISPR-associated protein Csc3